MAKKYEKKAYTIRPDQVTFLQKIAEEKGIADSAVLRWALDHYRNFLMTSSSTYRIIQDKDDRVSNQA